MPFTPAHVMAVLPGVRWQRALRLDPTCLVLGSMAPDFEYFARGRQSGAFSHTWLGLLVWGLPVTVALAALYHRVVKWPLLVAAPRALTPVFAGAWQTRWSASVIASVLVSAVLGNVTHLLWDGVTHANGLFVRAFAVLRTPYEVPMLGTMVLHRILQHVSTLVGLVGVALYLLYRVRAAPPASHTVPRRRVRIVFTLCVVICGSLTVGRLMRHRGRDPGNLIAGAISGMLAGAILASVLVRGDGRRYRDEVTTPATARGG
jgi:hypothetical protein